MRPTNKLHLGNYFGLLSNMLALQDEYECFYAIVDWHALTTGYENTEELQDNILDIAIDWLSAGVDPKKAVIFIQSHVKEHAELHLLPSMITPGMAGTGSNLQGATAGIKGAQYLRFPRLPPFDGPPISWPTRQIRSGGRRPASHLEFAREVARRFNHLYKPILPEPQAKLTKVPLLPDRREEDELKLQSHSHVGQSRSDPGKGTADGYRPGPDPQGRPGTSRGVYHCGLL